MSGPINSWYAARDSSAAIAAHGGLTCSPPRCALGGSASAARSPRRACRRASTATSQSTSTSRGGQVKDLTIGLPPGWSAIRPPLPSAPWPSSTRTRVPRTHRSGRVSANVAILGLLPLVVPGKLYNLEAQPGEPAQFGIVLSPLPLPLGPRSSCSRRSQLRQTDFGLNTVINDIPNHDKSIPATRRSPPGHHALRDRPGAGKPFMRNPTSCTPATTNFSAVPYSGADGTGQASFTPTGCDSVPFSPTFSARVGAPGQTAAQSHPPVSTAIDQDAGEAGLRNATVLLPPNFSAELNVLSQTCAQADFDAGNCPANSVVGTAIATSPLLTEPLTGPVALITNPGLPKVGLDLRGPLAMKLTGGFVITPSEPASASRTCRTSRSGTSRSPSTEVRGAWSRPPPTSVTRPRSSSPASTPGAGRISRATPRPRSKAAAPEAPQDQWLTAEGPFAASEAPPQDHRGPRAAQRKGQTAEVAEARARDRRH